MTNKNLVINATNTTETQELNPTNSKKYIYLNITKKRYK